MLLGYGITQNLPQHNFFFSFFSEDVGLWKQWVQVPAKSKRKSICPSGWVRVPNRNTVATLYNFCCLSLTQSPVAFWLRKCGINWSWLTDLPTPPQGWLDLWQLLHTDWWKWKVGETPKCQFTWSTCVLRHKVLWLEPWLLVCSSYSINIILKSKLNQLEIIHVGKLKNKKVEGPTHRNISMRNLH